MSLFSIYLFFGIYALSIKCDQQKLQQQQQSEISSITFQPWKKVGNFNFSRNSHGSLLISNRIYIFGGYNYSTSFPIYLSDVQFISIDIRDGTIMPDSLTFTQEFSIGRSGLGVAAYNSYVYLVGGFSGTAELADVQYGHVEENGQILKWQTSPYRLNIARSNHQMQIIQTVSGKIYLAAIAGVGQIANDTVHFDHIEVAQIYEGGSISAWHICFYHLKGGRSAPATNIINNNLYVIGGWDDLLIEDVFSDLQFAPMRDDGCPDPWSTSAQHLKMPLYGHTSLTIYPNTLIVLGGNAGEGNYFNNVQYTSVHTDDSDTKPWRLDRNQFSIPRYGHTSVQFNNTFIYVVGGRSREQAADLDDIQMSKVDVNGTRSA